jgi:hypothetical protein
MKQRTKLESINAILNALSCDSIGQIVRESGFKSYQALGQWINRNGYKLVKRYELIKIEESKDVKK